MYHKIVYSEPDYAHPNISSEAKDIMICMLMKDPAKRIDVAHAKAHKFYKSINFLQLLKKEVKTPFVPV